MFLGPGVSENRCVVPVFPVSHSDSKVYMLVHILAEFTFDDYDSPMHIRIEES